MRCIFHPSAGFTDETPRDYHSNLGPDGRRRDADERPELCRGTVEFVATKEYMVRALEISFRCTQIIGIYSFEYLWIMTCQPSSLNKPPTPESVVF